MDAVESEEVESRLYPDLEKICLLCLKQDDAAVNIFDCAEESIPLRIMSCTSLEVSPNGSMPKMICFDCRIQLERSYYFRKRAQYSYNKLKKHLRLIKVGKVSNVFNKTDEDDDEMDFVYSVEFLRAIDEEEAKKRQCERLKIEEELKERFRIEETNRIFEEARNFFNNKATEYLKASTPKPDKPTEEQDCKESHQDQEAMDILITPDQPEEAEADRSIESEPSLTELADQSTEKIFKFSYSDSEEPLEAFYLLKTDEEDDAEEVPGENHIEDTGDETNHANDEIIEEDDVEVGDEDDEKMETINMHEFDDTMSNNVDMFDEDKGDAEEPENFIAESNQSTGEDDDESSNQSQLALAALIQKSLLSQENLRLNGNIKFKVEQVGDGVVHVKVITEDGNVIYIEVQNENEAEALIEKKVAETNEELKIFKCALCPQAFTRRSQLQRHKSVHVKSTGYCCKFCKKWFACKSSLNRHTRTHTGEKPFECEQCGRKFIQKEILKRHLVTHTGVRPYPCPHCDKAFVQKQLLRQHINLKHTENPVVEMHECFLCPKSFCHASGLSRHLLIHSGVSYQCKKCGKKFNDKSAVKRHTMTVHANTRVLKIETDGKDEKAEDVKFLGHSNSLESETRYGRKELWRKMPQCSYETENKSLDLNESNRMNSQMQNKDSEKINPHIEVMRDSS